MNEDALAFQWSTFYVNSKTWEAIRIITRVIHLFGIRNRNRNSRIGPTNPYKRGV